MFGQKIEKEDEVAAVRGDGMGRSAALSGQPCYPQSGRGAQIVGRGKPRQRQWLRERGKTASVWRHRPRPSHCAMLISMVRARNVNSSVPSLGWKVSEARAPIHISPTGAERPKESRSNACERTSPAA